MIGKLLVAVLVLFCLSAAVFAQTPEVENWCTAGFFTILRIAVAAGKKNDQIYFYNDFEDDSGVYRRARRY
ncbi:MAG: hypothetical protein H0U23_07870 [Blastocatellia bacterium]|nr:hypothetical protein [Blastocatellia bacterium]